MEILDDVDTDDDVDAELDVDTLKDRRCIITLSNNVHMIWREAIDKCISVLTFPFR